MYARSHWAHFYAPSNTHGKAEGVQNEAKDIIGRELQEEHEANVWEEPQLWK